MSIVGKKISFLFPFAVYGQRREMRRIRPPLLTRMTPDNIMDVILILFLFVKYEGQNSYY